MRESALVVKTLFDMNRMGCMAVKLHGSIYGGGQPDVVGCYRGRAFAVEVKVGGRRLTRLQQVTLDRWRAAGAVAVVADEEFDVAQFLEALAEGDD